MCEHMGVFCDDMCKGLTEISFAIPKTIQWLHFLPGERKSYMNPRWVLVSLFNALLKGA